MTDDWVIDIEIDLVKAFGWSLRDIDETDIESLIPFLIAFSGGPAKHEFSFCDEVDFL